MKWPLPESKSVLVTGCSTGIGAATAMLLREQGWTVYPTARKPADLERLRSEGFDPIALDIADSNSVLAAADEALEKMGGTPGALVNNAGYGQPGALEDLSRDAMRAQFEVNVFGMQELTNRFIPRFREQGRGRIVNVSSVVGRVSLPFLGIYSASKFAMEAMSDALRVELCDSGIAVSLVEPGPITTHFRQTSVAQADHYLAHGDSAFRTLYQREVERRRQQPVDKKKPFSKPPAAVAEKILHALESSRPKRRYCVTVPAYAGAVFRRILPDAWVDATLSRSLRKKLSQNG